MIKHTFFTQFNSKLCNSTILAHVRQNIFENICVNTTQAENEVIV